MQQTNLSVKSWAAGVAITGAIFLSGCDSIPRTLADQQPFYNPQLVQHTVEDGEMSTVIHGRPFGGEQFDSDRAVTDVLRLPGFYPQASFRPVIPNVQPEGGYLVFAFDPASKGLSAESLCQSPDRVASRNQGGPLQLIGAFCYGDTLAANVSAQAPRPSSAQAPEFRQFMSLVLTDLLPPIDPNEGRDCQGDC